MARMISATMGARCPTIEIRCIFVVYFFVGLLRPYDLYRRGSEPWRRRMTKRALTVTLALVLTACVSVGKTVLMPDLAPINEENVRVFLPGDAVPRHDRVAILTADFNDSMSDDSDVLNKLRKEAAKLGANGIVIVGSETESDATRVARTLTLGADYGGRGKTQAFAILLRN